MEEKREKRNFNDHWLFLLGDSEEYAKAAFDDQNWEKVTLPHDWSILYELSKDADTGAGGGFVRAGKGWYRKHFKYMKKNAANRVLLLLDGVYMDSTVFINGKKVGGHRYGYGSYFLDITNALQEGGNVIAVRVDNSLQPNSRWYSGSGIYRNVWLIEKQPVHIDIWGIKCAANGIYPLQDQASMQIQTVVCNDTDRERNVSVIHSLYDADGKLVTSCGSSIYLPEGGKGVCIARPSVDSPHLWTDEDPYLYTLESSVISEGGTVDKETARIGIRTATFDCDRGFLLNGEPVKIKGMCVHHDCGIVGAAGYREIWERRLLALKEMGCNGIRCSHNPPDPILLDLCDEMGFLVMDEIFDEWLLIKNKNQNYYSEQSAYGSGQYFEKDAQNELETMIKRDYNHPSVILWSIGNEIPEQSSINGVSILRFLQDICHTQDESRMVTLACDNIVAVEPIRTFKDFENALDVVGYNYVGRWRERAETFYDEDRKNFPGRRVIGSENPSAGGQRGIYITDETGNNYACTTMSHEALWRYTISHDFVAGDFLWTGIDHLGEAMWPRRGAGCGPIDTAGFKKDTFYYFKSIWNQKETTLHLLPHWNWKGDEGKFKQVICYTNCEEVRLYINGKLVGSRGYECPRYGAVKAWNDCFGKRFTTNDLHLSWDVPYEPGVLRAEGYRNHELVAVKEMVTTKSPVALRAECGTPSLGKGRLAQIEICCLDEDGREVPDASPIVKCTVEGKGQLIGMDGGDLYDLSLYSNSARRMCAGKLFAIVKAMEAGKLEVIFEADGLEKSVVTLNVKS